MKSTVVSAALNLCVSVCFSTECERSNARLQCVRDYSALQMCTGKVQASERTLCAVQRASERASRLGRFGALLSRALASTLARSALRCLTADATTSMSTTTAVCYNRRRYFWLDCLVSQ